MITKEQAKQAWVSGECVQYLFDGIWNPIDNNCRLDVFDIYSCFRLEPSTITINGIEVPAPFEPKEGEYVYVITDQAENGWIKTKHDYDFGYVFGAWRTEEEIKQVVAALRSIFK